MGQPVQPPQFPLLISTMNDVPGHRITHVFGQVFGLTVRSRNAFSNFGAGLKSLVGGEVTQYTKMLSDSRHEALGRLCQSAMVYGANAVIAMRFDCNEIAGTMSEIAAYGTAVFVVPVEGQVPPPQVAHQQPQQPAQHAPQPQHQPPAYQQHQQYPQG